MNTEYHKDTFERIPQEKQLRILATAAQEFANKGFDNANINIIAEKSGVSVGALYKYFSSKEDLFLATVYSGTDTLTRVLNALLASDEDLFTKIEKIVRTIQSHSRQNQDLIKLYNEITSESNAQMVSRLSSELETISAHVYSTLIIQAQESGVISKDFDPHLLAFFLDNLFMTLQFSYACDYYQRRFKIYAGEDILDHDERVVGEFLRFLKPLFTTERGQA